MTQIRNYAIERLASTIYDDDLIDIQIMQAGADQYKEARMKVSELRKLMNDGSTPLRYKALISQNAPIAAQTSGTFLVGMIVSTTTYVAGDDFSNWTLVSGTVNTTGAVYQVTIASPTTWSNGSTLAYDGRPYIVSTDANGNLNPFVNTLGGNPIWSYGGVGEYYLTLSGMWIIGKVFITISPINGDNGEGSKCFVRHINAIVLYSFKSGSNFDGLFSYYPIEIEVYP